GGDQVQRVVVPVGIGRRAGAEIDTDAHQVLAADELVRRFAKLAFGKAGDGGRDAVDYHVRDPGRGAAFGIEHQQGKAFRPLGRVRPGQRRRDILADAIGAALFVAAGILDCQGAVVREGRRGQRKYAGGARPGSGGKGRQRDRGGKSGNGVFHGIPLVLFGRRRRREGGQRGALAPP